MALEQPFTTVSPVIASFSFTELASGVGYIILNGGITSSSNIFLSQPFTGHLLEKGATDELGITAPFAETLMTDAFDIDMPINKSTVINGKAFIRMTFRANISSSMPGSEDANARIRFILKDVDAAGTERIIGTSDFSDILVITAQSVSIISDNQFLEMDIDNKTIINGHKLRLSTEYYLETLYTGGGSIQTSFSLALDPLDATNSNFESNETTFKLYLPLKIEE